MIDRQNILAAFAMFEGAGLRKPDDWRAQTTGDARRDAAESQRIVESMTSAADLWATVLGDATLEAFQSAVLARLREAGPFWPTIGEIRKLMPDVRAAAIDTAEEAWAKVLDIARVHGRKAGTEDNRWKFDRDPSRCGAMWAGIAAAGGWDAIVDTTQHGFMRPAFLAAYRSCRVRRDLRIEGATVAQIAESAAPKRLEQRGGGFKRLGGA